MASPYMTRLLTIVKEGGASTLPEHDRKLIQCDARIKSLGQNLSTFVKDHETNILQAKKNVAGYTAALLRLSIAMRDWSLALYGEVLHFSGANLSKLIQLTEATQSAEGAESPVCELRATQSG